MTYIHRSGGVFQYTKSICLAALLGLTAIACAKQDNKEAQLLPPFKAISGAELSSQVKSGNILPSSNAAAQNKIRALEKEAAPSNEWRISDPANRKELGTSAPTSGIYVLVDRELVGKQAVFGGVITKVSNTEDESLGDLKLSDISPTHVKLLVADGQTSHPALALVGCTEDCSENSPQSTILSIPILGIDSSGKNLILDISSIADELRFMDALDSDTAENFTKLGASVTTHVEQSDLATVFDVETTLVPTKPESDEQVVPLVLTLRWYLKSTASFHPMFTARDAIDGVGYFMTSRSADAKIERHPTTDYLGNANVHYFVKSVPEKWQRAFAGSFDEWNKKFKELNGRALISYEFISDSDPRAKTIVAGDARYNVLEWDAVNKASYGGLGPSIANQFTGEIFSANVLIQGPTIMDLYTKWYKVGQKAQSLLAQGRARESQALMRNFWKEYEAKQERAKSKKNAIALGKFLDFRIHSQRPALADPAAQSKDFDLPPAGVSFEDYMNGYFHDMVAHELGHNLGLRHNFRGNLGSNDSGSLGSVSRSIMEYLGRPYRYLDLIGEYDVMALAYGYFGKEPAAKDWFCTDEDSFSLNDANSSIECNSSDATSDPFSFYEHRLSMALDYLLNRGQTEAPIWSTDDMKSQLDVAAKGLLGFAAGNDAIQKTWTSFFGKPGRPEAGAAVREYVRDRIKAQLCSSSIADEIALKADAEAKAATEKNINDLRAKLAKTAVDAKIFTEAEISCN